VVGGRIPPIASVIDDGQDGLLTSQTPDELAAIMKRLLSDPDECQAMGEAGRLKTQAKYTWDKLTQQTEEVYRSLGAGTRQGAAAASNVVTRRRDLAVRAAKVGQSLDVP
jgi:glycosyltransferase involved in cell wall biosynthesis